MAKFIELTLAENGEKRLINMDRVLECEPGDGATMLSFGLHYPDRWVTESQEEIKHLLKEAPFIHHSIQIKKDTLQQQDV